MKDINEISMICTSIHKTVQVAFKMVQCLNIMPDFLYSVFKVAALLPSTITSEAENRTSRSASTMLVDLKSVEFSYEELAEATNDFNLSHKIGQGGFASVYYGLIRNQVSFIPSLIGGDFT